MYVPTGVVPGRNHWQILRWARSSEFNGNGSTKDYSLLTLNQDGTLGMGGASITTTLKNTGKIIPYDEWFNLEVKVKYMSVDTYRISLYLNGTSIGVFLKDMPASDTDPSYILFFDRTATLATDPLFSYLDNIHIYEYEEADVLDITVGFDTDKGAISSPINGAQGDTGDISAYFNTANAAIKGSTDISAGDGMNCYIYSDPTGSTNYALAVASSRSHFAVQDINKKLADGDFVVSADMYLRSDTNFASDNFPLLRWTRSLINNAGGTTSYPLVSLNSDLSLVAGGKTLDTSVNLDEWFNITAWVKYLGSDSYEVSLYLDGKLISVYNQEMAKPSSGDEYSYIVVFQRATNCNSFYLDNLHIYEIYEDTTVDPVIDLPDNAPFNTTIDFDISASNVVKSAQLNVFDTADAVFTTAGDHGAGFHCGINTGNHSNETYIAPEKETGDGALTIRSNNSYFAVTDVNRKLPNSSFTVSADVYFTLTNFSGPAPIMQWIRDNSLDTAKGNDNELTTRYGLISVNESGQLVAGGKTLTTTVNDTTWYNITAKVTHLSGDTYRISLYLNNQPVYVYVQEMPAPSSGTDGSHIIFYTRSANCKASYLDNVHIYQEQSNRLNTTIDFDIGKTVTFVNGNGGFGGTEHPDGDISEYCDTSDTKFSSYLDYATGTWAFFIEKDSDTDNYYAIVKNRSWLAIEDINKRLPNGDFTVSADMYVPTGVTLQGNNYPLFRWTRSTITAEGGDTSYSLIELNKDGSFVANGKDTGKDIPYDTWFNLAAKVKYLGGDNYRVSLYLNNESFYAYNLEMPAGEDETSCIIFFARRGSNELVNSRLDNLCVYEDDITPDPLNLDFNGDYTSALNIIGKENYFPAIGEGKATVQNGYLRIDHNGLTADQKGYIVADREKFIGFDQYLIEADFRYSGSENYNAAVATIVTSNYASVFTPVGVKGTDNTLYTSIGSARYALCTKDGAPIKVKTTTETGFTKVAILVDESSLTYTVYVNGAVAYYSFGKEVYPCVSLPINFKATDLTVGAVDYDPQLRLLEINASKDNDCTLDISKLAVKALPSGVSSSVIGAQTRRVDKENSYDVRFVSGIDALYGSAIGFEIKAVYTDSQGEQTKEYDKSSTVVFDRIEVDEKYAYAHELDCGYLATIEIVDIPMETAVTITATPYVNHGGIKVYGEAVTETFDFTANAVEPMLLLDFDTALSVADYIASADGVELHETYKGGEIKDGLLRLGGAPLVLKDTCGVYDITLYSLEFDICFDSFVKKDGVSVFSLVTDDDGVLDGSSNAYSIRVNSDGTLYHQSFRSNPKQLETGKTYNIRYEVDRENKCLSIYFDDSLWVSSVYYGQTNNEYNCFRFMYPLASDVAGTVSFDNFAVYDTSAKAIAYEEIVAIDAAFIRSGSYADTPQKLANGKYIEIKETSKEWYREGLIKFDISAVEPDSIGYSKFYATFANISDERTFDIYCVDSDWDGETVTFNTAPKGQKIAENITFGGKGDSLDMSQYINEAVKNGDETFSIKIVPTYQSSTAVTQICFDDSDKPTIKAFYDKSDKSYFENLVEDETANKAIWDYAQQMYDEWYARYEKALLAVNNDAKMLETDETQYIRSSLASEQASNFASNKKSYQSRPLEALTDLDTYVSDAFKTAGLDEYGGIMIDALRQEDKGFFYTKKINGRWFIIDPLGYPYINVGLSLIDYSLNGSETQAQYALDKYDTYENWAVETTKQVRDGFGFNSTFSPREEVTAVADGLPYMKPVTGVMSNYALAKGGKMKAIENNVMPVFEPDFVDYANYNIKEAVAGFVNDPRIIGYTADNELPIDLAMLDSALSISHTNPINYYTYACTWTWFVNMTGKESPTYDDITDELRDLYRSFVYDRYFYVVSNAFEQADPNHMYMGCKFLPYVKDSDSKWIFAFAAQHVDVMTVNWYFCWEPETEAIYNIEKYGDLPFIVTEFYTKAGDATITSEEGSPTLGNTSGAGWYVATQTDRADYYDSFTIKLLESNGCVGWQWFHYMDNDPNSGTGDSTSVDSNKGICRSDLTYYTELTDRMTALNKNVYNIIDYFSNKKNAD